MNKITQLIEGYAKPTKNGWLASCSTTLIQTDNHKIIVDPGINKTLLLEKLAENDLSVRDIDYVFISHYHIDHIFLCALFENATFFDGGTVYKDDSEVDFENTLPDTNIELIATPGHAYEHTSLIVPTEDLGTVVVAADVFWWTDDDVQDTSPAALMNHKDPFTKDADALLESRKKILEIADWIIPGHGKMFKIDIIRG